ncbi:hypothetical protein BDAP_000798 [Binucleata daphniae]
MTERKEIQQKQTKLIPENYKFKICDIVLYKDPIKNDKLAPKYIGPFIIQSTNENGSLIISDAEGKITKNANRKQLKKYAKNTLKYLRCRHKKLLKDEAKHKEGRIVTESKEQTVNDEEDAIVKRHKICSLCHNNFE